MIGDRNSYVFGSIHNGVFEGKIITERDAYYVEHAKHYFPTNRTATTPTTPSKSSTTTTTPRSTIKNTQPTRSLGPQQLNNNNNRTAFDSKTENFIKKIAESTTATLQSGLSSPASSSTSSSTTFPPTTENSHEEQEDNAEDELDFHSIIYKESHVEDAYENVREGKSKYEFPSSQQLTCRCRNEKFSRTLLNVIYLPGIVKSSELFILYPRIQLRRTQVNLEIV